MILSIDIGGSSVKMGMIDRYGTIHARYEASVCFDDYETPILATVIREAKCFLEQSGIAIEGIGVSATGQIDVETGRVIGTNGRIPNYEGAEIKREMHEAFGMPISVLNDANAAVLGECVAGRAKGMQHVVMITLGTGVGGGVIVDGKLLCGTRGIAGELGHFTLYQNGLPCTCGKVGCYENYASTSALLREARRVTGEQILDGRAVFERAKNGDNLIQEVLAQWIDNIAAGVSGLVHIFNPQMVLIGGGVSVQEELLITPLRQKVLACVMPRFAEHLLLKGVMLGNDAGMIGAAKYCMDRNQNKEAIA